MESLDGTIARTAGNFLIAFERSVHSQRKAAEKLVLQIYPADERVLLPLENLIFQHGDGVVQVEGSGNLVVAAVGIANGKGRQESCSVAQNTAIRQVGIQFRIGKAVLNAKTVVDGLLVDVDAARQAVEARILDDSLAVDVVERTPVRERGATARNGQIVVVGVASPRNFVPPVGVVVTAAGRLGKAQVVE